MSIKSNFAGPTVCFVDDYERSAWFRPTTSQHSRDLIQTLKAAICILIAGVLFLAVPAVPASALDFDLQAAEILVPTGDWLEILPGQRHLYEFSYDSFEQVDGYTSEAIVDVKMDSKDAVRFAVYTEDNIRTWQMGGELKSIGIGSRLSKVTFNEKDDVRLNWSSRSDASQLYYVVVENPRNVPSYYEIKITGSGVAFPSQISEPAAGEEDAVIFEDSEALEVAGPLVLEGGTGPENALVPVEGEILLAPGEERWFSFIYYRDAGKDATQVIAMLKMPVTQSVGFEIWTMDTVRKWQRGEKFAAVGEGTPIGFGSFGKDPNTLLWVGSAEAGNKYFVIVKNKTDQPAGFRLTVTGPNISF